MAKKQVLTDYQIQDLIEYLTSSNKPLEEACMNLFDIGSIVLTDNDRKQIDKEIFCCESCDVWYDTGERIFDSEGQAICDSCNIDNVFNDDDLDDNYSY